MDLIDNGFAKLSSLAKSYLPEGVFTDLIAEGVIPGIGRCNHFHPADCPAILFHCHS